MSIFPALKFQPLSIGVLLRSIHLASTENSHKSVATLASLLPWFSTYAERLYRLISISARLNLILQLKPFLIALSKVIFVLLLFFIAIYNLSLFLNFAALIQFITRVDNSRYSFCHCILSKRNKISNIAKLNKGQILRRIVKLLIFIKVHTIELKNKLNSFILGLYII